MTEKIEQKLIFSIAIEGENQTVGMTFDPPMAGVEQRKKQSDDERLLQNIAAEISLIVTENLKQRHA